MKDLAQSFYEQYPYPEVVSDLENYVQNRSSLTDISTLHGFHNVFPGRTPFHPRVLVIGCGPIEACSLAFRSREISVVGIDISKTAIIESQKIKKKYSLDNLTLVHTDLNEFQPDCEFDLIRAIGVFHHTVDPWAAMQTASNWLADDGVLHTLLYGKTLRTGVAWLQTVLKTIDSDMVTSFDRLRAFVNSLPERHPVKAYLQSTQSQLEFESEAGFADTFLNPREESYLLSEILFELSNLNLKFFGFSDNSRYFAGTALPPDAAQFVAEISQGKFLEDACKIELSSMSIGVHEFFTSRSSRKGGPFTGNVLFFVDKRWHFFPVKIVRSTINGSLNIERLGGIKLSVSAKLENLCRQLQGAGYYLSGDEIERANHEPAPDETNILNVISTLYMGGFLYEMPIS